MKTQKNSSSVIRGGGAAIAVTEGYIPTSMFLGTVGLAKAIAACNNKHELQQLYTDNKERIDTIPELKQVFIKKKKEMRIVVA